MHMLNLSVYKKRIKWRGPQSDGMTLVFKDYRSKRRKQNSIRKESGQILTSVSPADVLLRPQVELELEHVFKHASSQSVALR